MLQRPINSSMASAKLMLLATALQDKANKVLPEFEGLAGSVEVRDCKHERTDIG